MFCKIELSSGMRFQSDKNAFKCGKAAYESGKRFSKVWSILLLEWLAKNYIQLVLCIPSANRAKR